MQKHLISRRGWICLSGSACLAAGRSCIQGRWRAEDFLQTGRYQPPHCFCWLASRYSRQREAKSTPPQKARTRRIVCLRTAGKPAISKGGVWINMTFRSSPTPLACAAPSSRLPLWHPPTPAPVSLPADGGGQGKGGTRRNRATAQRRGPVRSRFRSLRVVQLLHRPRMAGDLGGHRGRSRQAAVDPTVVVVGDVQADARGRIAPAFSRTRAPNRVKRRRKVRIDRLCRSTCDVHISSLSNAPPITCRATSVMIGGPYRPGCSDSV